MTNIGVEVLPYYLFQNIQELLYEFNNLYNVVQCGDLMSACLPNLYFIVQSNHTADQNQIPKNVV